MTGDPAPASLGGVPMPFSAPRLMAATGARIKLGLDSLRNLEPHPSMKTELKLDGLHNLAAGHLEKSLEAVPGVQSVELDHANDRAIIEHDGADLEKLTTTANMEGVRAVIM